VIEQIVVLLRQFTSCRRARRLVLAMNTGPLRVLIAEDNADLRDLLVTLVSAEPDLDCIGTANDVDSLLASARDSRADVLVLDLELQGRSSIEALRSLRGTGKDVSVIVFSGHSHPEMIRHTLAAGADAYVPKSGDIGQLLEAIRDTRAHRVSA
jgi:two-component system response regulator DesR